MFQKYFNLPHRTLGKVKLSEFGEQALIISNIGRTGYDGLEIGLENLDFWEGSFSFVPMERRLADASTGIAIAGSTLTGNDTHLFRITYHLGGESLALTVDNSGLEPQGHSIRAFRGEELVKESSLGDASFAIDLPPAEVIKSTFQAGCKFEFWKRQKKVEQIFQFRQSISIAVADEEVLEADKIHIIPQQTIDVEDFLRLESQATNIRAIIIFDEKTTMPVV